MLEKILDLEKELFFALNGSDSAFLDNIMWLYTGKIMWIPLALFIIGILVYKKDWHEYILIFLAITLVVTLCDQFASQICKPLFTRFRPTHHPEFMDQVQTVFDYTGGRYGFISSHAANAFGLATYMTLLFHYRSRLFTIAIFFWALMTAYTRIYLGVHFISDIIPGIIAGIVFGYLTYYLYKKTRIYWFNKIGKKIIPPFMIYSLRRQLLIVAGIVVTILLLLIFNIPLVHILR